MLGAALLLRLLTVLPALDSPLFSDEVVYHRLATNLAAGDGYVWEPGGHATAWRPPLWPATLALAYRLAGPRPAVGRLLQVGLGTVLVWVIICLAGALGLDDHRVPAVAGWWATVSPTLLYHSHCLFGETLFGILCGVGLLGLLRLQLRPSAAGMATAGIGLGAACLVRGTSTLLFLPLTCGWLTFCGQGTRGHNLRLAVGVLAFAAVVVLPWSVRNQRVLGGLALVDTNGPQNLLMGNHELTPFWRPWNAPELRNRPGPILAGDAGELARQRASLHQAMAYIVAHPLRCGVWLPMKAANLWGLARGLASGVSSGLYGDLGVGWVALAALWDGLDGLALLLCGVLGMVLAARREPVFLQAIIIALLTVIHGLSYGHSRYRFMALPLCFGFAAAALLRWRQPGGPLAGVSARRRRLALVGCGLLLLCWIYDTVGLELLWRWWHG